jgi:hypothetical protein
LVAAVCSLPRRSGRTACGTCGGGYPSGIYANDEASLDAAKANGFKLIELDFAQEGDTLVLQHDLSKPVAMSLDDLIRWLDRNPGPKIITDIKSDNLAGLAILKAAAGDHLERFIPQIYSLDEYTPVIAMGFQAPIFTVYRALLQRLAAVRGRLSLCADQAAAAKWWLSMPMASVSAEGPMPKALSTRRTSPLMPGCRHQGRACPLRRARMTSNPLIVA